MRSLVRLAAVSYLLTVAAPSIFAQQVPLNDVVDHAVRQSKLTLPGSSAFHMKAQIAEKNSPDSDFKADIEIFWVSPEKWRQTIGSPEFSQTLVVNGEQVLEQDIGDYYPAWLRTMVTALLDPLPMQEALKQSNTQIAKPTESGQTCSRSQVKIGTPPAQNSAFYVFCFTGGRGLLEGAFTPEYSVEFKNYESFKDRNVARLLVSDPEPGTTIQARITELSEITNAEENLFAIDQPTLRERRLESVDVSENSLRALSVQTPEIVWPSIRAGKTQGVLSLLVSVDRSGRVRETFPLNSDNPNLDDAARQQVSKWQFKPAASNGVPVQVESILTFAFGTHVKNPETILSDADARKLATNAVAPVIRPGTVAPGTSFTVRVSLGPEGKLLGIENPNNVPSALFLAAYNALRSWRFGPYLKDGKPDSYKADITFQVP